MSLTKLLPWRTPSPPVVLDDQGETARRHALLVSQASTLVASLKDEIAALGEVNQRLAAENDLLRAHVGLGSGSVQLSAAQARDEAYQTWNSLAAENAALLEAVDAHEVERSVLMQANQQIAAENVTLQDQRKRALGDQWMLKQINAALEEEVSALKALTRAANPSAAKRPGLNDEGVESLSGSSAVGGAAMGDVGRETQAAQRQGYSSAG